MLQPRDYVILKKKVNSQKSNKGNKLVQNKLISPEIKLEEQNLGTDSSGNTFSKNQVTGPFPVLFQMRSQEARLNLKYGISQDRKTRVLASENKYIWLQVFGIYIKKQLFLKSKSNNNTCQNREAKSASSTDSIMKTS